MSNFCSKCKKEITLEEYNYSINKYNRPLCRVHQNDLSDKEISSGLTKREHRYKEGMIKGRIAETLIEELFLSLGYNVFRYGMENTVPGVMKLLKGVKSDVAENIKQMPDFVIQDKSGECYFIIVSKKHIKCINYKELKEGKVVTLNSKNWLGNRKEFELNKETIKDFCEFAVKSFENA